MCCRSAPGEIRRVQIDKSIELLGIQIRCPKKDGGVFISSVTEHSIASKAGLLIGHQLLEVCGINLRSATYKLAASVLQQCGNSITMLVQYNPDSKFEFFFPVNGLELKSLKRESRQLCILNSWLLIGCDHICFNQIGDDVRRLLLLRTLLTNQKVVN